MDAALPGNVRLRRCGALLLLALSLGGCDSREPDGQSADGSPLSSPDTAGFARASAPRRFSFPEDHGAHPEFRHEWWYVTGNLDGPGGRRFGFQVTFFRYALMPHPAPRRSRWAAEQVYMAHFALTDVAEQRFRFIERRARGALGLAGAQTSPLRVWLEDWRLQAGRDGDFPWNLQAREGDQALRLRLSSAKPLVLQGEQGLSRKSAEPGNASYYYSATRLEAEGEVETAGRSFPVHGLAWLDREWSTSALAASQSGWDWFALQLRDGTELMYYRLRLKDGGSDPHSAGSFIDAGGAKTSLAPQDMELRVLDRWRARDGVLYPAVWQMTVKPLGRKWLIRPVVADQELRGKVMRYWEGAVDVFEAENGARPVGRGYVELTGYAENRGAAQTAGKGMPNR